MEEISEFVNPVIPPSLIEKIQKEQDQNLRQI